ncbi:uncharacterized protein BDZ83DRAFT_772040 [Colletotrichum acutatum]|uniref:HNH nuclease domain-containing protein n=1 Tax=Glomerella acutata TaxID=27357 RepID=A0AAD8UQY6_GLOAC|nr:uncharacterized protein BDZ83DRAFT_772040 [Colletotrichum acutatum]KAK1727252.1 hypothetical protein BDZ83DRAFT_772040 [Colletotrichum acutatum]
MRQLGDYHDLDEEIIPAGIPSDNAIPYRIQQHSEIARLSQDPEKTRRTSEHVDKIIDEYKDFEEPELSRPREGGIDVPMARLGGLDLNYKICQIEEDLLALRETSGEIDNTRRSPWELEMGSETKLWITTEGNPVNTRHQKSPGADISTADILLESDEHYWCHAAGSWMHQEGTSKDDPAQPLPQRHVVANIVPHFSNVPSGILEDLFRERTDDLSGPANSLLLSKQIQRRFAHYKLVIVPVDPEERSITRWKIDILDKKIEKVCLEDVTFTPGGDRRPFSARGLQDRELVFLNDKRPAARFLYFHFIMALTRLKDTKAESWKDARAKYLSHNPSPTLLHFLPS